MLRWIINNIVWFSIRLVVTLACIFTIQNVIHQEGYLIPYKILLVGAICLIVGVRLWMPSQDKKLHCANCSKSLEKDQGPYYISDTKDP